MTKILFLAANPSDMSRLRLDQEIRAIQEKLRQTTFRDQFDIQQYHAVRVGDLQGALLHHKSDIVHFSGHGSPSSEIILEDNTGESHQVSIDALSQIFSILKENIRCVVLNACYSECQAKAIANHIDYVVGMSNVISDDAAISFAVAFYQAIGYGKDFKTAFQLGCVQIGLDNLGEQDIPKFLSSSDHRSGTSSTIIAGTEPNKSSVPSSIPETKPHPCVSAPEGMRRSDFGVSWSALLKRIAQTKVIPFLGPGMKHGLLPSDAEIAERWAKEFDYPLGLYNDLPNVAQFVETKQDTHYPHDVLCEVLIDALLDREGMKDRERWRGQTLTAVIEKIAARRFDRDENEPHRILAELPFSTYITSNYDSFMIAALKWAGRAPQRKYCLWRSDLEENPSYQNLKVTLENPLVFHLYGYSDESASLVLTEDDYLDFLRIIAEDSRRIPQQLRSDLTESMLLFLGYNLSDLNCRVLFRGMVAQLRDIRRGRIAVLQLQPDDSSFSRIDELKNFMEKYCKGLNIEVYWGTLREFLAELRDRWEAEYVKH